MKHSAVWTDHTKDANQSVMDADDVELFPYEAAANLDGVLKYSYIVPCASKFRDQVTLLARKRNVTVGEMARSVLLVTPSSLMASFPDPGEPMTEDRETVILKSGISKGRKLIRKPRLQVRMAMGYEVEDIRRALAVALAIDSGELILRTRTAAGTETTPSASQANDQDLRLLKEEMMALRRQLRDQDERMLEMRASMSVVAFDPLDNGVKTRQDALYILGFASAERPNIYTIKEKFKMLAMIFHPDAPFGDHHRMTQLNAAKKILEASPLTPR